ncbi:hypothetical protein QFC24_006727 [Naganishia onofrii]|uniref:Uncharacterized protein n=1 Tax=Naganishia onofrii TaxID=1851511 RepID=A0ACC2WZ12_9TREE|nr:hypothetical protein QFC24_006727 [Naganishia onofrii]
MTEHSNRNEVRAGIAGGGWEIVWGDLINEWDVVTLIVSIPTGSVGIWVSDQVQSQVQKFGQSLGDVSDDVVKQATDYLSDLLQHRRSGEKDINGLGVKAGIATYNRSIKGFLGSSKLPNNHQPYIGIRVTKPLPPKGAIATPEPPASVAPAPPVPAPVRRPIGGRENGPRILVSDLSGLTRSNSHLPLYASNKDQGRQRSVL